MLTVMILQIKKVNKNVFKLFNKLLEKKINFVGKKK